MRIEQPYNHLPIQKTAQQKTSGRSFESTLQKSESKEPSAQQKLEQALEEKSWLTEQIQTGRSSSAELGKHLDLRV